MEQQAENILVAAAREGDREALEALLLRYEPTVYGFGMRMCRDPEDAKEVLQETLLAMARKFGDFRGNSSISTWVYTIARRFCMKRRRGGRSVAAELLSARETTRSEVLDIADPGLGPEERLRAREMGAAVARAISELPPIYREVFVLRDIEGLSASSVAEVLGTSTQAVKSRLHRARVAVRKSLRPAFGKSDGPNERRKTNCPDILTLFSRHLEGEISADMCATMEQHVSDCPACQERCDSLRETLRLCRTTPSPGVPISVQRSVREELRKALGEKS